jgi:peroxiredoxin
MKRYGLDKAAVRAALRIVFALLLVPGLLILHGAVGTPVQNASAAPCSGEDLAKDFSMRDLEGTKVSLSDYRGEKAVLLFFWATWCPYCHAAKPDLERIRREIGSEDLEVLAINIGYRDPAERVKRFQKGHPLPGRVLYDKGSEVTKSYSVQGVPLFVLVNECGEVVYRQNRPPRNPESYLQ